MRLPFCFADCFSRAYARKAVAILFALLYLIGFVLGIVFVKTPALYSHHISQCELYVKTVVFSDKSVFLIFLQRFLGCFIVLSALLLAGIHPVTLAVTPVVYTVRAYFLGGIVATFFSLYRVTGALVLLALYLPVRLLIDFLFLTAISLSFARAKGFCFQREELALLGKDFLCLLGLIALICLLEMLLLLLLFRSVGNLI